MALSIEYLLFICAYLRFMRVQTKCGFSEYKIKHEINKIGGKNTAVDRDTFNAEHGWVYVAGSLSDPPVEN